VREIYSFARFDRLETMAAAAPPPPPPPPPPEGGFFGGEDFVEEEEEEYPEDSLVGYVKAESRRRRRAQRRAKYREAVRLARGREGLEEYRKEGPRARRLWQWSLIVLRLLAREQLRP